MLDSIFYTLLLIQHNGMSHLKIINTGLQVLDSYASSIFSVSFSTSFRFFLSFSFFRRRSQYSRSAICYVPCL